MKNNNLETLIYLPVLLIFILLVATVYEYDNQEHLTTYEYPPVEWFETEIQVYFKDGTVTNYNVELYNTDGQNITLNDGNLKYIKSSKGVGLYAAYPVELASYVKSYNVVKSIKKQK